MPTPAFAALRDRAARSRAPEPERPTRRASRDAATAAHCRHVSSFCGAAGLCRSQAAIAAQRKLAPLGTAAGDRGNYRVTLDFPPERFHQLRLQEAGRLVEVRGRTVFMMDVDPAALRDIAGEYWVDCDRAWNGQ